MFPIKGGLRHFFQNLKRYSGGCRNWEFGKVTTITEFSLGQTLFLMLEAFLFRRVKIDIDILMMARTLVKQVRKDLGMYTFLFNRDTKCFFLL